MANSIDTAFIKQFESEVHMAYQRMGSKLRGTVRTAGNVAGNVVRFQKSELDLLQPNHGMVILLLWS